MRQHPSSPALARRTPLLKGAFDLEALEARQVLSSSVDDRFEDNDLPRTVVRATEGATNSPNLGALSAERVVRNLKLCDAADVFRIRLTAQGTSANFAKINFNNTRGNLDLQLLAANGTRVVRQSLNSAGPEIISLSGLAPGAYYVKVIGKNGAQNDNYTLTLNTTGVVVNPSEDAYENNDSIAEAAAAPAGAANSPNLGGLTGTRALTGLKLNDTYDIFKFSMASTVGAVSPKFIRIDSAAPLNLVLFNSAGVAIRSADAYFGQRSIDLSGLSAGEFYIQVTHYSLGTTGVFNYALNFSV